MKKNPVIAIDIDEVLSPFISGLAPWHNRRYGTSFGVQDFHTYEFHKVWGGDQELAIRKCSDYFENRGHVPPLPDAVRVLTRLKQNFELIVVTSRMLIHKTLTEEWINTHFPDIFSHILLCNHWDKHNAGPIIKKSAACLQYGAQYLIDDLPHYVADAIEAGMTGLLFGEYPWNQTQLPHPQIQRVAHWPAVESYFYPNMIPRA
jgi:5'(3')-deoxyribonucleotidase